MWNIVQCRVLIAYWKVLVVADMWIGSTDSGTLILESKLKLTVDSWIWGSPLIGTSPIVPNILSSTGSNFLVWGGPPPVPVTSLLIPLCFFLALALRSCQVYDYKFIFVYFNLFC